MIKKRPTIIDVAQLAGVSKSTVSLVLQKSALVKNDTREIVRKSMQELGYVYNRNAAKMRSDQHGLVGLVISDLRNPFFTDFAISLQMSLAEKGFSTVIANTDESADIQEQVIGSMIEHGVSALVMTPAYTQPDKLFAMIQRADVPTFQVLRQISHDVENFPFFSFNNKNGGRLAVNHLLERGCKKIAFVGGVEGYDITSERMIGYLESLSETGMKAEIFYGKPSKEFGREQAINIALYHPDIDGCFCFNDLVALGMTAGFSSMNVALGKDMLLIGFDDIEDCQHSFPPLSSVNCEINQFGSFIATSLLNLMTHAIYPPAIFRAPVNLSVRESTHQIA